jgi:hypothetical protein
MLCRFYTSFYANPLQRFSNIATVVIADDTVYRTIQINNEVLFEGENDIFEA